MSSLELQVYQFLQAQPHIKQYIIAYSGGVDSHVLLHIMQRLQSEGADFSIQAVHVNHNLHADSALWVAHCERTCAQLNIAIAVHNIEVQRRPSESLEAQARMARYTHLQGHMTEATCLLTAHHQDDQAETLLLQLLRGSGPKGLASMPSIKPFPPGSLGRPFLASPQAEIYGYAKRCGLIWVDDPSNRLIDFDRNFVRHEILPLIQRRWPSASKAIARSAAQCAKLSQSLHRFAQDALQDCQGTQANTLSQTSLQERNETDMAVLIRSWLQHGNILMPSVKQMQHIIQDVILSQAGATPCVRWGNFEIRRYRDNVYLGKVCPPFAHKPASVLPSDTVNIPGLGEYYFEQRPGLGFVWPEGGSKALQVRFRQGGETCQPRGRAHRHKLKKLLQEMAIPPWQRDRLPLLFDGPQMVAVADLLVCEPYAVAKKQLGYYLKRRDESDDLC
ncbi:MAG: tRNA lysidine(34) synthetase TilS [Thiohalomonadales bacterium]